ncbi:MAG: hypothetical protein ACSLEL_00245 [Candidatus Malihini olakiniferum]
MAPITHLLQALLSAPPFCAIYCVTYKTD